jgi:hypothetical protein
MSGIATYRGRYTCLPFDFVLASDDLALALRAAELVHRFASPIEANGSPPQATYELGAGSVRWGGRYGLRRDGELVGDADGVDELIDQLIWFISADTLACDDKLLLVHAGAVASPRGAGVLILGDSGSGKTTLVAALVQDGFGYLSDEAGVIDPESGLMHPFPRPLRFKEGTERIERFAPLLDRAHNEGFCHVAADDIRPGAVAAPCVARYVIDHRYEAGSATSLERLTRAEAIAKIGSATPGLRHHGARGLDALTALVHDAETYRLRSGNLDDAVHAIRGFIRR